MSGSSLTKPSWKTTERQMKVLDNLQGLKDMNEEQFKDNRLKLQSLVFLKRDTLNLSSDDDNNFNELHSLERASSAVTSNIFVQNELYSKWYGDQAKEVARVLDESVDNCNNKGPDSILGQSEKEEIEIELNEAFPERIDRMEGSTNKYLAQLKHYVGDFCRRHATEDVQKETNRQKTAEELNCVLGNRNMMTHMQPLNQSYHLKEYQRPFSAGCTASDTSILNQHPVHRQDPTNEDNNRFNYDFSSDLTSNNGSNPQRRRFPQQQLNTSLSRMQKNSQKSWENAENEKNSNIFQTALEYRNRSSDDMENGEGYNGDARVTPQQASSKSTYSSQHRGDSLQLHARDESSRPSKRGFSAGLKRKFQPPLKSRHYANVNNRNGINSRPSSSHSDTSQPKDDDLPEGLRGLDKDLIERIKNEIVDSGDPVTFNDIAGLENAKQTVMELVCWPMKRPDLFTGLRRGPNGLLLFGPPGTGKTLIGKAIAHESGATFFSISSSSLTSKWIGEGEKLVRTLFAVAAVSEPAVVFIDEIDSLLTARKADENEASRRIKTEFLVQLDGTGTSGQGRVLAIGATNRPHELDDAARRRFVKRLYIPLPEKSDRKVLLKTLLEKNSNSLTESDLERLAVDTNGFSGADLKALCTDAALGPIRQLGARALHVDINDVPPISFKNFRQALKGMNPSVAQADLEVYLSWNETYGSKGLADDDTASDDDET